MAASLTYMVLLFPAMDMGVSPPPVPGVNTLWSFAVWKRGVLYALLDFWYLAPIALPIGCTGGGFVVGGAVLAEEAGWRHADTLLPNAAYYGGVDRICTSEPSDAWHAYDAIRSWAPYGSGLLGLGIGTGFFAQFYVPLSAGWSLLLGLGLSVIVAGIVAVAAVGCFIVLTLLVHNVPAQGTRSSG
jgi:hypothetical protein